MRESIRSIQFLRFVAASLVVFAHSMQETARSIAGKYDIGSPGILYDTDFGAVGVHIFFVISGFIMVYASFGKKDRDFDALEFILRRFIRIYPIYWLYAILFVLYREAFGVFGLSTGATVGSFLLVPGYSQLIITPGWTLSFEVYFYVCFALFMTLGLSRGLLAMTAYFAVSVSVGSVLHSDDAVLHLVTNALLSEFLAGAWIAYLFVSGVRLSATVSNALVLLALGVFVGGLLFGYHRIPTVLSWGVPSALLIGGCVFKERSGSLPVFIQKYSYLGDSSYSLYLIHYLLISAFLRAFFAMFSKPQYPYFFAIGVGLTLVCIVIAIILYDLVERRVVSYLQKMLKNIRASSVASHAS
jgi:exopolysaccharide production protein ExoZ